MYIKTKSVHFDAITITVVMLGKFVCTFFLWEGQGHFWIRIKFHLGRAKGRGIIQQDINFISGNIWPDKLLMPKNIYAGTFK